MLAVLPIAALTTASFMSAWMERQRLSSAEYVTLKELKSFGEKYVGEYIRTRGILHDFLGTSVSVWNNRLISVGQYSYLLVDGFAAMLLRLRFNCHILLQKWVNVTGRLERLYGEDGSPMGYVINVVDIASAPME